MLRTTINCLSVSCVEALTEGFNLNMKKSSQMIEWLKESKFANKTPVDHMFWVRPTDICKRSDGQKQTIGDLCFEIEQQLSSESDFNDADDIQDWYVWNYYPTQGHRRCVFTQMPPLDKSVFHGQPCGVECLARIKKLLVKYESVKNHHHSGRILATDGVLSWLHLGTGLQWTTFSYLQSSQNDYAEVLNEVCYAGHEDWRIPTISEIRAMFSADKEMLGEGQHPLADSLPTAMPLPVEQTPDIHSSADTLKGYYVFNKESTARTGTRYNRSDERIDDGGHYTGRFIAVRGQRKLQRSFQTAWAGTLLAWTERNMSLVEQGQLSGSSAGWKRLERLMLRGEHFKNENYKAAFAAMNYLNNLKEIWMTVDEYFHEIPDPLYNLSQIKKLHIWNNYTGFSDVEKWSITLVSSDIERMKSLEDITLSWQVDLTRVPDEMFDLPNLTSIQLGGCWNLILSEKQVIRVCELAEAGVSIDIPPLKLHMDSCRTMLLRAVKESGGEINWNTMKSAFENGNDS